jgi:hypothetical protein
MATLTVEISDGLKDRAEAVAIKAGFSNLSEYVTQFIIGEAAGAPEHLTIDSDDDLEKLLLSRINGPRVKMDAADFRQMREKLRARLDERGGTP